MSFYETIRAVLGCTLVACLLWLVCSDAKAQDTPIQCYDGICKIKVNTHDANGNVYGLDQNGNPHTEYSHEQMLISCTVKDDVTDKILYHLDRLWGGDKFDTPDISGGYLSRILVIWCQNIVGNSEPWVGLVQFPETLIPLGKPGKPTIGG